MSAVFVFKLCILSCFTGFSSLYSCMSMFWLVKRLDVNYRLRSSDDVVFTRLHCHLVGKTWRRYFLALPFPVNAFVKLDRYGSRYIIDIKVVTIVLSTILVLCVQQQRINNETVPQTMTEFELWFSPLPRTRDLFLILKVRHLGISALF